MTTVDGEQPQTTQSTAFGWCAWHKGHADDVRLIRVIEQGTGPGGCLFSCGPCRDVHRLIPLADQP